MEHGSLAEFVRMNTVKKTLTTLTSVCGHSYEAALGLQFLHERGIPHGDLRLESILIGGDGIANLANISVSGNDSAKSQRAKTIGRDVSAFGECLSRLNEAFPIYSIFNDAITNLVEEITKDVQRFSSALIASRLHKIITILEPDEPQREPCASSDDVLMKLEEVKAVVDEFDTEIYRELYCAHEASCRQVIDSNLSISGHVLEETISVLAYIQVAIERQQSRSDNAIQRLSSSGACNASLSFFRQQMLRLITVLEAPPGAYHDLNARWKKMRKCRADVFVSEIDRSLTLIRPSDME